MSLTDFGPLRALCIAVSILPFIAGAWSRADKITDTFESGLGQWSAYGLNGVRIHDTGDPAHGKVMVLSPNGDVHALLNGTDSWSGVRLEFDVLFPSRVDSYLGIVSGFKEHKGRMDFGLVYLKGEGYFQANPHWDYNVTRTFYPEYQVEIPPHRRVETGHWQRLIAEMLGNTVHVYLEKDSVPIMTFSLNPAQRGAVGFQARSVGSDVWIDNVRAEEITRLRYEGAPIPAPSYRTDSLLTQWDLAGPFRRSNDNAARRSSSVQWRRVAPDIRGAIATAPVVDYHGERTVAYFRTTVTATTRGPKTLHVSSVEDLAVWVNGRFAWFIPRTSAAWFDFWENPAHAGRRIPVDLDAGANEIVVRVRGGAYAGGGFFARMENPKP